MNFKKLTLVPLAATLAFGAALPSLVYPTSVSAAETDSETVSLKFSNVSIENKDNVNIERTETSNSATVKVFDKTTGTLLVTYGETVRPVQSKGVSTNATERTYIVDQYTDKNEGGNVVTRLTLSLEIYQYNSFRQINRILDKNFKVISDGPDMKVSTLTAVSNSGSFPTTSVSASATGNVELKGSTTNSAGVDVSILETAGFNISYSTSTAWTARKAVSSQIGYSVY